MKKQTKTISFNLHRRRICDLSDIELLQVIKLFVGWRDNRPSWYNNLIIDARRRREKDSKAMPIARQFYVAGVQHHDLNDVIDDLEEGDDLDLVPEPDNKYDSNAVKIMFDGVMLGYVPQKFSAEVSAALQIGDVACTILTLDKNEKPWKMLEVAVISESSEDDVDDDDDEEDEE